LVESPADVGDGLHEGAFFGANGLKFRFVGIDVQDIFSAFLGSRKSRCLPVRPDLTALRADLALPSGDVGPPDFWAFSRLAARRAAAMGDSDSDLMVDSSSFGEGYSRFPFCVRARGG
jgi:hypothetical protein